MRIGLVGHHLYDRRALGFAVRPVGVALGLSPGRVGQGQLRQLVNKGNVASGCDQRLRIDRCTIEGQLRRIGGDHREHKGWQDQPAAIGEGQHHIDIDDADGHVGEIEAECQMPCPGEVDDLAGSGFWSGNHQHVGHQRRSGKNRLCAFFTSLLLLGGCLIRVHVSFHVLFRCILRGAPRPVSQTWPMASGTLRKRTLIAP